MGGQSLKLFEPKLFGIQTQHLCCENEMFGKNIWSVEMVEMMALSIERQGGIQIKVKQLNFSPPNVT